LYAEAFAADATLADDPRFGHRFNAARAAALTGCGQGEDATGLGADERKRWRDQARQWLQVELVAWAKVLDGDPTGARQRVRQQLTKWRSDPELAGLREPAELAKLSAAERKDCLALWDNVGALFGRCGP
jgi:serine/threonine-protein kinase